MYRYRKEHPMSVEQYMDEPAVEVDWVLAFSNMEAEIEAEAIKKAQNR